MNELIDWLQPGAQSPRGAWPQLDESTGALHDLAFAADEGPLTGKLFIPATLAARPPLLVLLHGCSQTAEEFATATRMAEHAERTGCLVFFPTQCLLRNANRCWNWFTPAHQQRGAGEPALIAHAVREISAAYDVDPRRVYVGGLSAGAAMAVVMGQAYPDLFAAVGVHSGIAYGSAIDAVSALDTMRRGPGPASTIATGPSIPTIVFHGAADKAVHQSNGKRVIEQCVGSVVNTHGEQQVEDGGGYVRTVFTDAHDQIRAEYWEITDGGHAWSGGEAGASFSDPGGPDASREMLRFFEGQRLRPRVATLESGPAAIRRRSGLA